MDIQLEKHKQYVSLLDLKIGGIECKLNKAADSGHTEICHTLEMRTDERVHMRAVLRDKEERLSRKEERFEQLILRLRYLELKLEESFCENAPIKRRYIQASAENSQLTLQLIGLRGEEEGMREQLEQKRPSLEYLETRRLNHILYRATHTQCYGDGTV